MVIDSDLDLLWLHPLGDVGFMPYLHYLKIAEWIVYHRMLEKNYFLQYITQCKANLTDLTFFSKYFAWFLAYVVSNQMLH